MVRRDTRKEYLIWRYANKYKIDNSPPISEIKRGVFKTTDLLKEGNITVEDLKSYLDKFIGLTMGEPGEVEKSLRAAIVRLGCG